MSLDRTALRAEFEIHPRFVERCPVDCQALGDQSNVHAEPPEDPVREVLQEMLDEFERVQLLLRTSPRLREKHGD